MFGLARQTPLLDGLLSCEAELLTLRGGELMRRAKAAGVSDEAVMTAQDEHHAAMVSLVLRAIEADQVEHRFHFPFGRFIGWFVVTGRTSWPSTAAERGAARLGLNLCAPSWRQAAERQADHFPHKSKARVWQ